MTLIKIRAHRTPCPYTGIARATKAHLRRDVTSRILARALSFAVCCVCVYVCVYSYLYIAIETNVFFI